MLTSQTNGIHTTQTAIECKYLNKKITKDVVFKLSGVINDSDIEKGIIVSRCGFTRDAIAQVKVCNNKLSEVVKLKI